MFVEGKKNRCGKIQRPSRTKRKLIEIKGGVHSCVIRRKWVGHKTDF